MLSENHKESFLSLIRTGIGWHDTAKVLKVDWGNVETLAREQGLLAVLVDGVEQLPDGVRPPKALLLQWIGETLQQEAQYVTQQKIAADLASLFHSNNIRTYVLKGEVIAECYPNPSHRCSADLDCFLLPDAGSCNAWALGNSLVEEKGIEVSKGYYKNSTFHFPGLTVENHQYFIPFRGNKKLKDLERVLESMLIVDKGEDRLSGTWLYRPPVMVSALFLIEHAYSHFLHEGLTWRHVLDWVMFKEKHQDDIQWDEFMAIIEAFGFKKFYTAYVKMCGLLLGEVVPADLELADLRMLNDIWAPLDLHETLHGVKGKIGLVGNTLRARWKYSCFSDISMIHALWIQVTGFLFNKNPQLD